jgi:hypothetical protein
MKAVRCVDQKNHTEIKSNLDLAKAIPKYSLFGCLKRLA